ncbi:hypothetical protein CLOM621_05942 [Clostridium sp. M62/1]|nr:hypothetical protein CLOM621_05942 [Clostridium sp. M62/1]
MTRAALWAFFADAKESRNMAASGHFCDAACCFGPVGCRLT